MQLIFLDSLVARKITTGPDRLLFSVFENDQSVIHEMSAVFVHGLLGIFVPREQLLVTRKIPKTFHITHIATEGILQALSKQDRRFRRYAGIGAASAVGSVTEL